MKLAVTSLAASTLSAHGPVPLHAPPQPANTDPAAAVALSVIELPWVRDTVQVEPHEMPLGDDSTVPLPVPAFVTFTAWLSSAKLAPTLRAALIVTVQAPVPVHAPLQPAKREPVAGVALSVTTVPLLKALLQLLPQSMPAGDEPTVPLPAPLRVTVSVYGVAVKVAITSRASSIVTVQAPLPVQAPDQPLKVEPLAARGVSDTLVPSA